MIKSTDFIIVDIEKRENYKLSEDDIQDLIRKKIEGLQDGSWSIKQIINIESKNGSDLRLGKKAYFYLIRLYLLMELKNE
jgi:hypothetical protein